MSFEEAEAAWALAARTLAAAEALENGEAPALIHLTSPYGVKWRPGHGDWIPFRHGEVTLPPLDLD